MSQESDNLVKKKNKEDEYCGGEYDEKVNECCETSTCCKKFLEFEADTRTLIKYLDLDSLKKNVLIRRYSDVIADYERKRDCVKFAYRLFQMIVTVGSILTPSLLSIQMTDHVKTNFEFEINISVWVISVFVSICNGIIHLFKLDELYVNCALTCEKLKTLWYKYITLTKPFDNTTHSESFNLFIVKMEELIMEQKFAEFIDSKANKNKPKEEEDQFNKDINMLDDIDDIKNNDETGNDSSSIVKEEIDSNSDIKIKIVEDNEKLSDDSIISSEMKKI